MTMFVEIVESQSWWQSFKETVDLLLHSNVHNCGRYKSSNEEVNQKIDLAV